MFQLLSGVSLTELLLLYGLELICLIYLLNKYKKYPFYILIIFIYYQGIFFFLGANVNNAYKILILIFTLWLAIKQNVFSFKKGDNLITIFFAVFSLFYAYSISNTGDNFTLIFSQYSRYVIIFCLWFLVRHELYKKKSNIELFQEFIYKLFLIQIIITIVKLIIFAGRQIEGIVGSVSHFGGSLGTTIPIVGFIMLWFYRRGIFKRNDWIFVVGLMSIGFAAGKRAVWFMLPLVIAAFMIYVPRLKMNSRLYLAIFITPVVFYLGIRLTPSLNPEHVVWGSFDYEYAFDTADKYQFGDKNNTAEKRAQGRGGATNLLVTKFFSDQSLTNTDWFGLGLSSVYKSDYDQFDKLKLGIHSKGSATGFFQSYTTTGFMGVFSILFFYISMLWQTKMKRIRWVLISIMAWEYFMYIGDFFRNPALMFMIIYFIHYSNYLMRRQGKMISV